MAGRQGPPHQEDGQTPLIPIPLNYANHPAFNDRAYCCATSCTPVPRSD